MANNFIERFSKSGTQQTRITNKMSNKKRKNCGITLGTAFGSAVRIGLTLILALMIGCAQSWVSGHTHRKYAHVIATDKVDSYRPAPGYEWIDPDGPIGPVRWEPGQKHPQYAHVVSAEKEGYFQPEPGYEWDTPGKVGPVHRITEPDSTTKSWVPGHAHRKYAHVIATDKVDSYRPAPGYEWIDPDGPIGPVRWEPGQKHPQYAHVVSAEKEGYFQPEPGYEWDTPGKVGPVHRITEPASRTVSNASETEWTAMGRRLSWQMSVPSDWFGGSYDQLRSVMESSQSENLRRFFEAFIPEVQGRDAALFHLPDLQSMRNDPSSLTTSTMTAIRIDVIPFTGENYEIYRQESGRRLIYLSYADTLRSEVPPGSSVTQIETRHFLVGGRDAYEATFRTDLSPSGSYYTVLLNVLVREGAVHNFTLEVDSSRFSVRRNELRGMLRTLRYESSMPNVGTETQVAYQDCMDFYSVRPGHPKYSEIKKVCRNVTKTMKRWKALKKALCASTPNDPKCIEFRK